MIRRGWGVGAAALAAAMLVTGCSGDPEPVVTPSPTPTETVETSASPTPTPSATALTDEEILAAIPEAARTEDFPGAQAFAEFFAVLSQDAFATADVELFEALSLDGCVFCSNTVDAVNAMVADGARAQGGSLTPADELAQGGLQDDGDWRVVFDAMIDERSFVDAEGGTVATTPAEQVAVTAVLRWDGEVWRVVDVASEAQ